MGSWQFQKLCCNDEQTLAHMSAKGTGQPFLMERTPVACPIACTHVHIPTVKLLKAGWACRHAASPSSSAKLERTSSRMHVLERSILQGGACGVKANPIRPIKMCVLSFKASVHNERLQACPHQPIPSTGAP